jgi:hypothetical protein
VGFYSQEEKDSFPQQQKNIRAVAEIFRDLRDRYGDRLDLYMVDPRNVMALWDNFRYGVRPAVPAWILGRKKVFEGIPDAGKLRELIDAELAKI